MYDFAWLQSKTGSELMSVSSDGQCLWWDVRKLGEPLETLTLKVHSPACMARHCCTGGLQLLACSAPLMLHSVERQQG